MSAGELPGPGPPARQHGAWRARAEARQLDDACADFPFDKHSAVFFAETRKQNAGGGWMSMHGFLNRLACVGLVLILIFPLGQVLFPYMAEALGHLQFGALEAVVTAALGNGLYATLFS
jgi:hypothetical protein